MSFLAAKGLRYSNHDFWASFWTIISILLNFWLACALCILASRMEIFDAVNINVKHTRGKPYSKQIFEHTQI